MNLIIVFILINSIFNVESKVYNSDYFAPLVTKISSIVNNLDSSSEEVCNQQVQYIINAFSNDDIPLEPWILGIFDSWGKIPSGITYGNIIELGNFDQCLDVTNTASSSIEQIGEVKGQYCLLPMSLNLGGFLNVGNLNEYQLQQPRALLIGGGIGANPLAGGNLVLMNGICVPKSCEPSYIFDILREGLSAVNVTIVPMDPNSLCLNDGNNKISAIDIITIIIFAVITGLMIASTSYDIYKLVYPSEDNRNKMWCISFSVMTNGKQLFACKNSKSPDVITCLNGIRVLSLIWVIYGHAYAINFVSPVINLSYMLKWIENIYTMVLIDATVSVDTFFVLSGLLVTWNILKELRRNNGKINVPLMYFHRYLRIISPLIMTILFQLTFLKHFGDGPFSNFFSIFNDSCEKWWYTALLFVQNYVNPNEMCLTHTWYLQVDMQLFVLSPLLIVPLYRWGKKVIPVVCTLIFLSMGCSFATFYLNKMKLSIFGGGGNFAGTDMDKTYFPTHIRMGSWLVGVLLGYMLYKIKGKNIKLPLWLQIGGCLVSLGTMIAVVFGPYNINQVGYKENLIESTMYSAFSRVAWCLAVSWVIFACATGHGYFINSFLSMRVWLPFTRLSYSMYLLSFIIQIYRGKTTRVSTYLSDYNSIYGFWGDFAFTFMISVYWALAFEYPVAKLESYLRQNRRTKIKEGEGPITNSLPPPPPPPLVPETTL